ncbi:MAG: SUMF1/EgtB/PvdO family nonheme iron enzyme [Bacteroidota bacterium]
MVLHNLPPLTLSTLESDHMAHIQGGTFMMGGEVVGSRSLPVHEVKLDDFYMSRFHVTQALYEEVMKDNPSEFPHPKRPVEKVSWYDAVTCCNALSRKHKLQEAYLIDTERKDPNNQNKNDDLKYTVALVPNANGYRLPTEAEWEYAALGGKYAQHFEFTGSPNKREVAVFDENSHDISQPVGLRAPNALGLYDLSGNVREWVWDWHDENYYETCKKKGTVLNPNGPSTGSSRGVRGGSWIPYYSSLLRVAFRISLIPNLRYDSIGFRLCRYSPT